MTKKEFEQLHQFIREMEERLRKQNSEEIRQEVDYYRKRLWSGRRWCCQEMEDLYLYLEDNGGPFMARVEDSPIGIQLRGVNVNYCPFCGMEAR